MPALLTLVLASLLQYVDLRCPAASVPFGMVQAGPEKCIVDGRQLIRGFSHSFPGREAVNNLGDMLIMPATGLAMKSDSTFVLKEGMYASPFTPGLESAGPGSYDVYLEKPAVRARITAGHRIGVHEYSFKTGSSQQIVVDLNSAGAIADSSIMLMPESRDVLLVCRNTRGRTSYYRLEFSSTVKEMAVGNGCALLDFGASVEPLCVIVGVSGTSFDNADMAIGLDWAGSFDDQRNAADEEWESYLKTIRCPFKDTAHRKAFYTALYGTALQPVLWSDANGDYRGMDGQVHNAGDSERYTLFPMGFTARELHPLLCQIAPQLTEDFIQSFVSICRENGRMPEFELFGHDFGSLGLCPAGAVMAEALRLGICGFDLRSATQSLIRSGFRKDTARESFRRNGFVSAEDSGISVLLTLEFAYEDWCLARVAQCMAESSEHPDEAQAFRSFHDKYMESAQYWRNVFDPVSRRMRGRINGRWAPIREDERICCFNVPHDIIGLTRAMGGPSAFCEKLDSMMVSPCWDRNDMMCRRIPHMYALAGQREKSDSLVAEMMEECFRDGFTGKAEDFGALSAWYVRSAVGEYQMCPGEAPDTRTFMVKTIVANPVFEMAGDVFTESLTVSIANIDPGCSAWYRCGDGEFLPYSGPFTVSSTCTLEAFSESLDGRRSLTTRSSVRKGEDL